MNDQGRMRRACEAWVLYCAGWAWDARRRGLPDLAEAYERVASDWRAKAAGLELAGPAEGGCRGEHQEHMRRLRAEEP